MRKGTDSEVTRTTSNEKMAVLPLLPWILAGFAASYLLFYLLPVFLNPQHTMLFAKYLPATKGIGADLGGTLSYSRSWLIAHHTPYIGANQKPPLTALLFSPLLFMPSQDAYLIVTACTLAGYAICSLWFPTLASSPRSISPILLLTALTGLLSYGFQWELERGQFDIIAMTLALGAIGLFHTQPRFRWASYVLITLSIQLKVYPAIFIIALVDDWRNWKKELLRLLGVLALNFACLFALGPQVFQDFATMIRGFIVSFDSFVGDHSASTFAFNLTAHPRYLELAIFALFGGCLLYAFWESHARQRPGLDPYLLLTCCIGALIIPSISNDYTLPILVPFITVFFQSLALAGKGKMRRALGVLLLTLMSFAYSSMLFSYATKSSLPLAGGRLTAFLLGNNFVPLLVVLLAATALTALGLARREKASAPVARDPTPSSSPEDNP